MIDGSSVPESEMNTQVVMGKIAPAATNFRNLLFAVRINLDASSYRITVAAGTFQTETDPMILVIAIVPVQARTIVQVDDENVEISVIVIVRDGGSTSGFAGQ